MAAQRYAVWLWLLLVVFALRVLAQPAQLWLAVPWLPPYAAWHSGVLPYPVLLALQALILAAQARIALAFSRGHVTASQSVARRWLWLGAVYFAAMLTRLVLGASLLSTQPWFSAWLPTAFHLVLASFVLVVGIYHWRHGGGSDGGGPESRIHGWWTRLTVGMSSMPLPDGFTLMPNCFDATASADHLQALVADLDWEEQRFTIYGRTVPMPRLIAMYGPVGYRYSGVVHPPRALPKRLDEIRRRAEEATGRVFNSVLANLYRDGRDSVGWHRDSDYAHGGQPDIGSVSFGATRRFELRDREGRERIAVDLESGSVLLITGEAVPRWWHRVAKTSRPVGPRVNLTFRHMVAAAEPP